MSTELPISRRVVLYLRLRRAMGARFGHYALVGDRSRREVAASTSSVRGESRWRAWHRHLNELAGVNATPNGVPVRGLRVLRTTEYRRLSIWRNLISLAMQMLPGEEDRWFVLSVYEGQDAVAQRRFPRWGDADRARVQFVQSVERMSSSECELADWQAVLDAS